MKISLFNNMGKKISGIISIHVFILAGAILFFGCENDMADIEALTANLNTTVEVAKEVEILYSDSAKVKVKIEGPTMLYYLDKSELRQEFPDGVKVDFFGPDKEISSILTAKYAIRYEKKSQVVVRDSVVWQSMENERLESEELIWDERTQKVFTNKFVRITRPDEIIYGYGFEANQDFSYSKINAIQGRLKVDNKNQQQDKPE